MNKVVRIVNRPALLFFGLVAGLVLGACTGDLDGTGDIRIDLSCDDYCDRATSCNDNVDRQDCIDSCKSSINDCMADEQEQALDQIDTCSAESCDDFAACTIDAGAECYFGL